jgi:hypothetical protein
MLTHSRSLKRIVALSVLLSLGLGAGTAGITRAETKTKVTQKKKAGRRVSVKVRFASPYYSGTWYLTQNILIDRYRRRTVLDYDLEYDGRMKIKVPASAVTNFSLNEHSISNFSLDYRDPETGREFVLFRDLSNPVKLNSVGKPVFGFRLRSHGANGEWFYTNLVFEYFVTRGALDTQVRVSKDARKACGSKITGRRRARG